MEQQPHNTKTILIVVVILLIIGLGYALSKGKGIKGGDPLDSENVDNTPEVVVIEDTSAVDGVTPPPAGFPSDIPIETGVVLESSTTHYPELNARQLSLSYQSTKNVSEKYTEYKNYLNQAGYAVTEGSSSSPVRAIFGTKDNANLSIVISNPDGETIVQVAYLLKSL